MQLSQHFTLAEFMQTETGLPNQPNALEIENLKATAERMEGVRDMLGGNPILVRSAFRSPAVNMAVRGSLTSDHCHGLAVDFTCPDFGDTAAVARFLSGGHLEFDQLILEWSWVHLGWGERMRGQILTKRSKDAPYMPGLIV
jgi:zinc D-Ala-D-Ala carboxypeptidase